MQNNNSFLCAECALCTVQCMWPGRQSCVVWVSCTSAALVRLNGILRCIHGNMWTRKNPQMWSHALVDAYRKIDIFPSTINLRSDDACISSVRIFSLYDVNSCVFLASNLIRSSSLHVPFTISHEQYRKSRDAAQQKNANVIISEILFYY